MAEPNFSYAEQPPWLRNDAQYDFSPFALGVQTAQREKDRALDERRLSVVEAEAPYRQKLLQQESEMTQFKLDDALRQRDQLLEAEREARLLPSVTDSLLQEGEALKAFSELLRAAGKKPILWSSPTFNQQLKSVGEAVKSTLSADRITEMEAYHNSRNELLKSQLTAKENAAGSPVGKLLDDLRLARERGDTEGISALQKSIELETSNAKEWGPSEVQRLLNERARAIESGRIDDTRILDAALQKATSTRSITTRIDPATGEVTITEGTQDVGGLEKTTKAQIEQKLLSQETLVNGLNELLSSGASQYFGPQGAIGNLLVDKLFANVYGDAVNPERVSSRQKLQGLKNIAVRALSDDRGQLSRQDQERVERLFPTGGYVGSPAEADILLRELADELKKRAVTLGRTVGKVPAWSMTDDELRKAAIDGTIDRAEAQREFLRRRPVVVPPPK